MKKSAKDTLVMLAYPVVVFAVGSLFILPNLFHIFEFRDRVEVPLAGLNGHQGSREITLVARPLTQATMAQDITSMRYRTTKTTTFVPLVSGDWRVGQPVPAILMGKGESFDAALLALESGRATELELHNVLWEGTPSDIQEGYAKEGFDVAGAVTVTPVGSTPKFGFVLLLILTGAAMLGARELTRELPAPAPSGSAARPKASAHPHTPSA